MDSEQNIYTVSSQPGARLARRFVIGNLIVVIPLKGLQWNNDLDFSAIEIEYQGEVIEVKEVEAKLFAFLKSLATEDTPGA